MTIAAVEQQACNPQLIHISIIMQYSQTLLEELNHVTIYTGESKHLHVD